MCLGTSEFFLGESVLMIPFYLKAAASHVIPFDQDLTSSF